MDKSALRDVGLKVTLPRVKILEILQESDNRHMSAEEVYKRLMETGDDVGLATVYRVLTQFEAAGLVLKHHFEGERCFFELASDEHHDHLVCVQCGDVEEFVDEIIESRQAYIAEKHNFKMQDHSLVIYGKCNGCVDQVISN